MSKNDETLAFYPLNIAALTSFDVPNAVDINMITEEFRDSSKTRRRPCALQAKK